MLDHITGTAAWQRRDVLAATKFGMARTEQAYLRAALSAQPRWFDGTTAVVVLVVDEERAPLRFMMAASSASTGVVPAIFAAKGAPSVPGQRHVAGMGRRQNGVLMEAIPRPRRCQGVRTRRAGAQSLMSKTEFAHNLHRSNAFLRCLSASTTGPTDPSSKSTC